MIGAASAASLTALGVVPSLDPITGSCAAWLADGAEIDRLQRRWGDLETWLVAHRRWFDLSNDEQRALPEAGDLDEIDAHIQALSDRRAELLAILSTLTAGNLTGVAAKLAVAVKMIHPEDDPRTHHLLVGILRELASLRCAGCGALLIADVGA